MAGTDPELDPGSASAASPERATAVVGTMNGGGFRGEVLSDRTAVTVVPETEAEEEGTNGPGPDTGEPPAGAPAPPTGEAAGP